MPIHSSSPTTLTAIAVALFGFACGDDNPNFPHPQATSSSGPGVSSSDGGGGEGGHVSVASTGGLGGEGGVTDSGGGGYGGTPLPPPPPPPPSPLCGDGNVVAGEVCYGDSTPYSATSRKLVDLAVFDCDGDTDLDVVAISSLDDEIVALINDGLGQFTDVEISSSQKNLTALAFGELDGHEGTDIVTISGSGPDKSFTQANAIQSTPCGFGSQAPVLIGPGGTDVALIDINDDNALDFVGTLNGTSDQIAFWVNQPNTDANHTSVAGGAKPTAIVVGDVDGDMKDDVVYTAYKDDKIRWRSGNGFGFASEQAWPLATKLGKGPNDLVMGDVDGDDCNDIVTVNETDETISVLLNSNCMGLFQPVLPYVDVATTDVNPRRIAMGDIDNDGDLDVVTANHKLNASQGSSVSILLNNGNGVFELATIDNSQGALVNVDSPIPTGRQPVSIALADLNDDGVLDIITGSDYVPPGSGGSSNLSVILSAP